MRPRLLPLVTLLCVTPLAHGQYTRAREFIEKIKSMQGEISPDRDKAAALATAKALLGNCIALDALVEVGQKFAELDGPYSEERRRVRKAVQETSAQAAETRKQTASWIEKLEKGEDWKSQCEVVKRSVGDLLTKWSELTKQVEWTRNWLASNLQSAGSAREQLGKTAAPAEKAQDEPKRRMDSIWSNVQRAFDNLRVMVAKLDEAESKENDAFGQYQAEVAAGSSPERIRAASLAWNDRVDKSWEVGAQLAEARKAVDDVSREYDRAIQEYAAASRELRRIARESGLSTAGQIHMNFQMWNVAFERDFPN